MEIRQARPDDYDAVAAFTRDTWSDRADAGDYIPDVFREWVDSDGSDQRTLVAEVDGAAAGLCQFVLLSEHEAWAQGMRVDPDHRGKGIAVALNEAGFEWARERGATVCRNMVFSWNAAGLGTSRSCGFDPVTEFRWAHPDPDPDAEAAFEANDADLTVTEDPDAAWSYWQRSDAAAHLRGLTLDREETWALSEATRERFRRAADETAAFAVRGSEGTRGAAYRTRAFDRETDGETETWVEYGVGAWADLPAARALFAAIARDATALDADRTRVLIPETARHVSDAAYAGAAISDDPDFVLAADLTGDLDG